jgi:hypothetical protein
MHFAWIAIISLGLIVVTLIGVTIYQKTPLPPITFPPAPIIIRIENCDKQPDGVCTGTAKNSGIPDKDHPAK